MIEVEWMGETIKVSPRTVGGGDVSLDADLYDAFCEAVGSIRDYESTGPLVSFVAEQIERVDKEIKETVEKVLTHESVVLQGLPELRAYEALVNWRKKLKAFSFEATMNKAMGIEDDDDDDDDDLDFG